MERVAVFVDAGYLFAQGSAAISGSKKPRTQILLNEAAILQELRSVAANRAANIPLLRIYWYDGADSSRGPTAQHVQLAHSDDVKIRLGFLNSVGEQKGVDSLIVTDLVDLARNRAVCDAVVLSGDEDIRIGVQIAQSFGVRVHLLGIVPSRGSQSRHLQQEADTTTEWDRDAVSKFLSLRPADIVAAAGAAAPTDSRSAAEPNGTKQDKKATTTTTTTTTSTTLAKVVDDLFKGLVQSQLEAIRAFQKTQRGVPPDYDGRMLATARTAIGRDLSGDECRFVRSSFLKLVAATAPTTK